MTVRIQAEPFDTGSEISAFQKESPAAGAIVSFTGIVRDDSGDLQFLEIEHYPEMTSNAIEAMSKEAQSRWTITGSLVIHRFGKLAPGAQIMMVATAAPHRADAFAAAEFLMDFLKSRAPFWKKEITVNGESWVDAKETDEQALERW